MIRRGFLIYTALLVAWAVLIAWQVVEHRRVYEAARQTLTSRARAITSTLGLVIRSQTRFGGIVSKDRLESALADLIKEDELSSITLLNAENSEVAHAGAEPENQLVGITNGVTWTGDHMILANLMDLGTNLFPNSDGIRRAIVVPPGGTNQPPPGMRPPPRDSEPENGTNQISSLRPPPRGPEFTGGTNDTAEPRPQGPRRRGFFGRPPWMTEEAYKELIAKQGVHSFVIRMSTQSVQKAATQDLWMRVIIGLLASASVGVAAIALRNLERSSDLELRLVKASEMNSHLKQMNLAAAGLAHETRNPLNIIRGLAQMISKQTEASGEVRDKSHAILEETDRVTAQLNEFISYSRPREVRRSPVAISRVVGEVARALTYDAEEKRILLKVPESDLVIEADEQLLRQALFNLLLNAVQAVEVGGEIDVVLQKQSPAEALIEVRDSGPGVPPDNRTDVFKPYFTASKEGTGLGLAVVQQIVLAHGWDIECLGNEPRGAVFRINHLRIAHT